MTQTVSHDDSGDVFTATITVPQFNTSYSVSVTAINSCGLSSQPATTTVFIEARGLWMSQCWLIQPDSETLVDLGLQ